jgi:methyltransferase (TIGR00027 family)
MKGANLWAVRPGQPSRTALAAATHRAAHQLLEGGRVFYDPLALRILAEDPETVRRRADENPYRRRMRLFIAVRTRFAEEALASAVERGVRQVVVLGAGLDTYAYRNPFGDRLRIFEVDHPATQAWKRYRLASASIPLPASSPSLQSTSNARPYPTAWRRRALMLRSRPSSPGSEWCPTLPN